MGIQRDVEGYQGTDEDTCGDGRYMDIWGLESSVEG